MPEKQEKFVQEINKLPFEFYTKFLDLPEGNAGNEDHLELDSATQDAVSTQAESMGKDLDKIFDILNQSSGMDDIKVIVHHRWNGQAMEQS